MMQLLQQKHILHTVRSNIWETTDVCAEIYWCETKLYLLWMLSHAHDIIIYLSVGAPGNIKYVVDGLNSTEKMYLSM